MQRHWEHLGEFERNGFTVVVDKTWEDIHPGDLFDDSVHDLKEICDKIDRGVYDWFMLRVRCLIDGHELGFNCLGGCLYENPKDVLTDGTVEDILWEAMNEAKAEARRLSTKLFMLTIANSHTQEA